MFKLARLTLTGWYVLILLLIVGLFSLAFYSVSTREVNRLIVRWRIEQEQHIPDIHGPPRYTPPPIESLISFKGRLKLTILIVDVSILFMAAVAAYFLSSKTLQPIQTMVHTQNQFISDASHQLRTPIAVLRTETETALLAKTISDAQAKKLLTSNLEELSELQTLTDSLLQLAKSHTHPETTHTENLLLSDIIARAHTKIYPLAHAKQITISTHGPEVITIGNKAKLVELLVLLLDNAVKYSPPKVRISVTVKPILAWVLVTVQNPGKGIPTADIPHVFDRFFRSEQFRFDTEGFGLGLAIAKKIVTEHKGTISITSQPGKRTLVQVKLPIGHKVHRATS